MPKKVPGSPKRKITAAVRMSEEEHRAVASLASAERTSIGSWFYRGRKAEIDRVLGKRP